MESVLIGAVALVVVAVASVVTRRRQPRHPAEPPLRTDDTTPAPYPLPVRGLAEIRVVAATPEEARQVAQAIRDSLGGDGRRSDPAGEDPGGTRLNLTVHTARGPSGSARDSAGRRPALGNTAPTAGPVAGGFGVTLSGYRPGP